MDNMQRLLRLPLVSGQTTAQRLIALVHLYQRYDLWQVSVLMARTLDKLLTHEAEV